VCATRKIFCQCLEILNQAIFTGLTGFGYSFSWHRYTSKSNVQNGFSVFLPIYFCIEYLTRS
jgi:hypothetical protein